MQESAHGITGPIIAAVRGYKKFEAALESDVGTIFLLAGELIGLRDICAAAKTAGKSIFIHLDLIKGLSKEEAVLHFLSREIKPTGVITTHRSLIQMAKKYNLFTVQRFFLLDSTSLANIMEADQESKADFIELMPGVVPKYLRAVTEAIDIPVIAGGLIEDSADVKNALDAGCIGVSTSKKEFWSQFTLS